MQENFPFGDKVVHLKVNGERIIGILELGLSNYPDPSGTFMQVFGIHIEFDSSRKAGDRILRVTFDADKDLSYDDFKSKTFVVAMPSVMGYLEKLGTRKYLKGCERMVDEEVR